MSGDLSVFTTHESEVRSYCRAFPTVFTTASGHLLTDVDGRRYVDFLSGASSLNYGHNEPAIKRAVMRYLERDGVLQSLDLHTAAKADFIEHLVDCVLEPRGMRYKLQFPGPTGTNAVEAALKLARKVKGRPNVIAFTNAYHGMSLGSLAATAARTARRGAGLPLAGVTTMPYDGYLGPDQSSLHHIERMLAPGSGVEPPAAFILETVQAEGGLNAASPEWLEGLQRIARAHDALVIVDDIQAGCGRAGHFFSFEGTDLTPDIVVLSKSLSGLGLPLSLVLLRPDLDAWMPGEHNGTFRGHNLAFVGAVAAIRTYWSDRRLEEGIERRSRLVRQALEELARQCPAGTARVKGRGLMLGLEVDQEGFAEAVSRAAFEKGLIVETCGVRDQVVKLLPPLNIPEEGLRTGLDLLADAFRDVLSSSAGMAVTHV
ncbi:MAG TPA: diaminobutyrate--2-oxoglutarate transaminase [Candidatus Dormibacteraeota bacterium]|nr:diaminobutyrate--2-oxoglutarate transaminase [Candidatus Dormibacteraeota bacterium]